MPVDGSGPPGDGAPTLAALLHVLAREGAGEHAPRDPLSAALRIVRNQSSLAPLDLEVAGVLRNGMLRAIRRELGDRISDLALRSLSGKPLTRRSVEQILQAAADLSAARSAALASASSMPLGGTELSSATHSAAGPDRDQSRGYEPGQAGDHRRANGDEHDVAGASGARVNGSARTGSATSASAPQWSPTAAARPAATASSLEEILRPLLEGRHEALLRQCVDLTRGGFQGPSNRSTIGEAAAWLHDRVRTFLEKQGRWPIRDADEYERHAKPTAVVMAAWDVPIALDDL